MTIPVVKVDPTWQRLIALNTTCVFCGYDDGTVYYTAWVPICRQCAKKHNFKKIERPES